MWIELQKSSEKNYTFSLPKNVSSGNVLFILSLSRKILTPDDYTVEDEGNGNYRLLLNKVVALSGGVEKIYGFYNKSGKAS